MFRDRETSQVLKLELPRSQCWRKLLDRNLANCEQRLSSNDYICRCRETSMTAYMIRLFKEMKLQTVVTVPELECVLKSEQPKFDQKNFESAVGVIGRWTSREWFDRDTQQMLIR